jgi:hypothetical protein
MFGAKKRIPLGSADRLDRLRAAPVQMFGGLPRSLSDRDLVDDLAAADVQMNGGADALPDIKSVGGMPRFSYRGPEVTGRDRLRGIAAALDDFGGGNAFETFMSGQDKRQRGDYDAAMGGLDKVQQTEPLDRMQAGMGQDERDLFAIAPELALKRMYPEPQKIDPIALAKLQLDREKFGLDREKFGYEQTQTGQMTPFQRESLDLQRQRFNLDQSKDGNVTLPEARQWANSYNDDVDGYNKDLGILRPALPYAQKVVRSNGDPGGNFRMDDVALLRAAARAQTGPGVLMESEVYGTLSPSLRQKLQSGVAYVDVAKGSITPEDRLALAQYVMQGGSQTAGDVWRRYDSTTKPLRMRGVEPESVGVLGPEMIHPDDMQSFLQQPLESFQTGKGYTGPSGRRYIYRGQGRFQFANENAYNPSLAIGQDKPAPTPGLPPGVVVRRK